MANKRVPKAVNRTQPPALSGASSLQRTLPRIQPAAPREGTQPTPHPDMSQTYFGDRILRRNWRYGNMGSGSGVARTSPPGVSLSSQNPISKYQPVRVGHIPRTPAPPSRLEQLDHRQRSVPSVIDETAVRRTQPPPMRVQTADRRVPVAPAVASAPMQVRQPLSPSKLGPLPPLQMRDIPHTSHQLSRTRELPPPRIPSSTTTVSRL